MSWDYIAGFFDGEGSVYFPLGRNQHYPKMSVVQSQDRGLILLTEIRDFLLSQGIHCTLAKPRMTSPLSNHPMHCLDIYGRDSAIMFLKEVGPRLRIKRVISQDIIRFLSAFPSPKGYLLRENRVIQKQKGIPWRIKDRVAVAA